MYRLSAGAAAGLSGYDGRRVSEICGRVKADFRRRTEIQIEKVMGLTKLGEVRNRLIANLSKGYKQRVGLAQASLRIS